MLMLLSVYVTSVLFLVRFNNFPDYGLLLGLHALTLVAHSYALLLGHVHRNSLYYQLNLGNNDRSSL